jgi:hypothetical protein
MGDIGAIRDIGASGDNQLSQAEIAANERYE